MNVNKYGKNHNNKIPSNSKKIKKNAIKKSVNSNKEYNNNLKYKQYINNQEKQVQRNQSSIVQKADNIENIKFDSNGYYNPKKNIRSLYKGKKLTNLSHNKIADNKSINESNLKMTTNKNTINRNESLNKIIISSNKKKKISKIPSSLGKKTFLPKSQSNNRQNHNKTQLNNNNLNVNHNYNFNFTNNNLNSNKLIDINSNKNQISKYMSKLYQNLNQQKSKDNSFDIGIGSSSIKNKKLKGSRFIYNSVNEQIANDNGSNQNNLHKKKIFNNSVYYDNNINSDLQKRNKTVIGKKELNSMKEETYLYNLDENKENLILKNTGIFNFGKLNLKNSKDNFMNHNINNLNQNKNDEIEKDKEINKKINNIIEHIKIEKKNGSLNKIKYNNQDINNEYLEKLNRNKSNRYKDIKFNENADNLDIIKRDEIEDTLSKNNNINLKKKDLSFLNKENEDKNISDNNYNNISGNLINTYNNNIIAKKNIMNNGLFNKIKITTNDINTKLPDIIDVQKTQRDEIQNINYKFNNLNPKNINIFNNKNNEIIKINIKNIKNKYQNKRDINKIKDDENIPKLITQSLTGLVNLGETCYMNAGLQNIIHCIPFIKQLFSILNEFKDIIEQKIITYSFINLCLSLIKNENYDTKFIINSYDPTIFRKNFCKFHKEYADDEQHDSLEFLRVLLDDISKELNQTKIISKYKELVTEGKTKKEQNNEYNNFYLCRENSIIVKVFYSQIMNEFTCDCGDLSYSFEKILDIPLLFPNDLNYKEINLNDLLVHYFNGEKISWSLACQKCGKKDIERSKKIKLTILPEVIIFSLQRFNPISGVKINKIISFEETIDLKPFCDTDFFNGEINTKYKLFGISNHSGTINFGHYVSYTKVGENWYEFNDSFVKQINLKFMSRAAYFFFYEKTDENIIQNQN